MSNYNLPTLLFSMLVVLAIAVGIVKVSVAVLNDRHRKIVGGIVLLMGIVATVSGVISVTSVESQHRAAFGQPDLGGRAAIGLGLLSAIVGVVIAMSRKSSRRSVQASTTKKCPACGASVSGGGGAFCGKCGSKL